MENPETGNKGRPLNDDFFFKWQIFMEQTEKKHCLPVKAVFVRILSSGRGNT